MRLDPEYEAMEEAVADELKKRPNAVQHPQICDLWAWTIAPAIRDKARSRASWRSSAESRSSAAIAPLSLLVRASFLKPMTFGIPGKPRASPRLPPGQEPISRAM